MVINPYWHDPHIPSLWNYQGSDQVQLRANNKIFDPSLALYKASELELAFDPSKQEHLYALHNACTKHQVLPIAFRTWFLEDTSRIPKALREFPRIYFAGTVARHTFGTPCIFFMQKISVSEHGYESWSPGSTQLIPQSEEILNRAGFIHV